EDRPGAVRGRQARRRRAVLAVPQRDLAGGAQRDHDRGGHHDDRRAGKLRPRLRDDERWSRRPDQRPGTPRLSARLQRRRRRRRERARDRPDGNRHHLGLRHPLYGEEGLMKGEGRTQVLRYAVLILLALAVLLPFVGVILASLHPSNAPVGGLSVPDEWSWENFGLAWEAGNFSNLMRSGFIISVCVVPVAVLFAMLAGYAISVLNVWGGRALSATFVLG